MLIKDVFRTDLKELESEWQNQVITFPPVTVMPAPDPN